MRTLLSKSPEHFIYEWLNPKEDTDALRFGRIFHMAVLEPDLFREQVIVMPEFTGLTKDGRASTKSKDALYKKKAWLEEHEGHTIMTQNEQDHLIGMLNRLQQWQIVMNMIRSSKPEASFFCSDPVTKILLKTRPDLINMEMGVLVDFKTTQNAEPNWFKTEIARRRYHIQLAFQKLVCEIVLKREFPCCAIIASEKEDPHSCVVFQLGEPVFRGENVVDLGVAQGSRTYLKIGEDWVRHGLNILQQCIEKDRWPSYTNQVIVADPPGWLENEPLPLVEF